MKGLDEHLGDLGHFALAKMVEDETNGAPINGEIVSKTFSVELIVKESTAKAKELS